MERFESKKYVTGLKQTRKAVQSGKAVTVFIAADADMHVVLPLEELCAEKSVEIVRAGSMKELARACRVEVPTAAAVIVKNA